MLIRVLGLLMLFNVCQANPGQPFDLDSCIAECRMLPQAIARDNCQLNCENKARNQTFTGRHDEQMEQFRREREQMQFDRQQRFIPPVR